jgi:homoserine O-acetyltransferase/O-succinyltransferase
MRPKLLLAAAIVAVTCASPYAIRAFRPGGQQPAAYPPPKQADVILKDFHFRSGETMDLKMHYRALGSPEKDAQGVVRNAVLVMHGTGGAGSQFTSASFAGELFGPGQLLDVTKYFLVLPDDIGHGQSSKPSDGLHAKFPQYGYLDMIEAERRLLVEGLGVNHLRLVMGTSMGGMHTWLWGEEYPDMMDALMPLASLPTQIAGRNRVWRRVAIDAIRNDPEWKGGEYATQPQSLRTAAEMLFLVGDNPVRRQRTSPTLARADQTLDAYVANYLRSNDANDVLYALSASRDYDPGPKLEQIKAPLLAVNFADDLINPPELGILEKEITRVPKGRAVVVPFSDRTAGHGTHTLAAIWKQYLEELLKQTSTFESRSSR